MLSQRAGFIVRVEPESLRPVSFDELPHAISRQAAYADIDSSASVVVLDREQLASYTCEGREEWAVDAPENLDMAFDRERGELVLTDGSIRDASDGTVRREVARLDGCSGIAVRPGGEYVGVSRSGVIRVWEESRRSGSALEGSAAGNAAGPS
jgi:hypothetical protein